MYIEEIDTKDIEFGEPIEEREPNYRDGYIQGIYRARNIIDSKQKEIERLNNIINELEKEFDKELESLGYREEKLYTQGIHDTIINYKYKLQELKGSDSNE